MRIALGWFPSLPLPAALGLGRALGRFLGGGLRYRRGEAAAAMRRSLPGMDAAAVQRVLDEMYENIGLSFAESLWLTPGRIEDYLRQRVRFERLEVAQTARSEGPGALVLTAHTGNFDLLCRAAPALGFPLTIIAKRLRSATWDAEVRRRWAEFGVRVLPPRGAYRECLRSLRRGELVGFMLDQNMTRDEGVFVEFFGRPACTTPGLAHLSAHSGAPVVPVFMERLPAGRHALRVGEPMSPPARDADSIVAATQAYTRVIEDWVRAHPGQWIWIHRRWKTRPEPAPTAVGGAA